MFTLIRPKIWGVPGLPGLLGDYIPVTYIKERLCFCESGKKELNVHVRL